MKEIRHVRKTLFVEWFILCKGRKMFRWKKMRKGKIFLIESDGFMNNLMFKEFFKKDKLRRGLWLNIVVLFPFSSSTEKYYRKIESRSNWSKIRWVTYKIIYRKRKLYWLLLCKLGKGQKYFQPYETTRKPTKKLVFKSSVWKVYRISRSSSW